MPSGLAEANATGAIAGAALVVVFALLAGRAAPLARAAGSSVPGFGGDADCGQQAAGDESENAASIVTACEPLRDSIELDGGHAYSLPRLDECRRMLASRCPDLLGWPTRGHARGCLACRTALVRTCAICTGGALPSMELSS